MSEYRWDVKRSEYSLWQGLSAPLYLECFLYLKVQLRLECFPSPLQLLRPFRVCATGACKDYNYTRSSNVMTDMSHHGASFNRLGFVVHYLRKGKENHPNHMTVIWKWVFLKAQIHAEANQASDYCNKYLIYLQIIYIYILYNNALTREWSNSPSVL